MHNYRRMPENDFNLGAYLISSRRNDPARASPAESARRQCFSFRVRRRLRINFEQKLHRTKIVTVSIERTSDEELLRIVAEIFGENYASTRFHLGDIARGSTATTGIPRWTKVGAYVSQSSILECVRRDGFVAEYTRITGKLCGENVSSDTARPLEILRSGFVILSPSKERNRSRRTSGLSVLSNLSLPFFFFLAISRELCTFLHSM